MLLCGPPPPLSTLNDCSCANLSNSSLRSWRNKLNEWTYHPVTACSWLVWCVKQFSNWASGTCKIIIEIVQAIKKQLKINLKYLWTPNRKDGITFSVGILEHCTFPYITSLGQPMGKSPMKGRNTSCCLLYCWAMTLKMNNIKMWHRTKSLCFPCFVLKLI